MSLPHPARFATVDAFAPVQLMLPGKKPVFFNYILTGGQTYLAGSVLGMVTATGKLVLSAFAAGDGSQTPIAILPEHIATFDIDGVTPLDMSVKVLVEASVNGDALQFGAGHSVATTKAALAARNIYVIAPHFSG